MSHVVTITVPATDHSLTTLAAVKERLGITDTSKDALLTDYITRASAMIESYIGRSIGMQTVHETWHIPRLARRDFITLAYANVSVTTVTEDLIDLTADTDYVVETATGVVYRQSDDTRWRWGYSLAVDYDTGWASVPADVEAVCIDLITSAYTAGTRDPGVQLELTEGVGRTAYFNRGWATFAFDDAMKTALVPYMTISA